MTTAVVLVRGDAELTSWPLDTPGRPDLSVVDEVARLQLAARRLGCEIRLRGVTAELCALLDLSGLAEIVEVRGQPERGEEICVEERVEPADPLA